MKSPKDMRIIQIDITNACVHRCSNCTRFCGHYRKPFFMSFETFKRAVDSLDGFEGTVSMMGGEPTLHPEFARFTRYLASKYPEQLDTDNQMLQPQSEFMKAVQELELQHTAAYNAGGGIRQNLKGPGLWSTMGESYKAHYELIQDVFKYQALNDHSNAMYHQPVLISRKDLGIEDKEWCTLRDNCWVQNEWSASVTPKGAFFCEIAGALDMLFDGPGGWEIEPCWWRREVKDFQEQLHWCELCGMACQTFSRDANEQIDDVSASDYERLCQMDSPWMKHVKLIDIKEGRISKHSIASDKKFQRSMPYAENYQERFNSTKSVLYPQGFVDVEVPYGKLGMVLRKAIYMTENKHQFIFVHSPGISLVSGVLEFWQNVIFNPGTLICTVGKSALKELPDYFDVKQDADGQAFAALLSPEAVSLKEIGFDRLVRMKQFTDLQALWQHRKILHFGKDLIYNPMETELRPGRRYAIYGTGEHTEVVLRRLAEKNANCVCFVDSKTERQGQEYHGKNIQPPAYLKEHRADFDYVIIGSPRYYVEIVAILKDMGFEKHELVCSY